MGVHDQPCAAGKTAGSRPLRGRGHPCQRNYDQTKQIAADFAQRQHLLYDRGASSIPARESMKTIAYEIVEQLGWRSPTGISRPSVEGRDRLGFTRASGNCSTWA